LTRTALFRTFALRASVPSVSAVDRDNFCTILASGGEVMTEKPRVSAPVDGHAALLAIRLAPSTPRIMRSTLQPIFGPISAAHLLHLLPSKRLFSAREGGTGAREARGEAALRPARAGGRPLRAAPRAPAVSRRVAVRLGAP
jgi:hypothetical protein